MAMLLFIATLLALIMGTILLKINKKIGFSIFGVSLVVSILFIFWFIYEGGQHQVESTELTDEHVGLLHLYAPLDEVKNKVGEEFRVRDNVRFHKGLEFVTFSLGINEDNRIIYITQLSQFKFGK